MGKIIPIKSPKLDKLKSLPSCVSPLLTHYYHIHKTSDTKYLAFPHTTKQFSHRRQVFDDSTQF